MNEIQITLSAWADHFGIFVPFLAFFAAFGETLIGLGWLLPGSTILLILGILAGQGVLDFGIVLIAGIVGAFLGDLLNYTLGKRYGSALLGRPWLHLPESAIQKAHDFLDSHGSVSIFLARFIPGLKETVPFLAGSARMDRGKFIFWNLLGSIGWGFEFVGIGYLFSSSLTLAQTMLGRTAAVIGSLAIALVVLWMLMRFLQHSLPILWEILQGMAAGFRHSAPVERFCRRHPRFVAFLADRFRDDRFTGLPLTILTLLSGYILILFGGIVEDFLTRDPIVYLDQIVANLMAQWRTPELIRLFTWITYLGRAPEVAAVLAAVLAGLLLHRRYREALALLFSVSGALIFLTLGKLAFHRPRPEIAYYFEPTWSFPSGHATIAVALYGFLGYLLIHHSAGLRRRLDLFFATLVLVLAIAFSRIYLAEHYLSDVYAGLLLGSLWAVGGVTLLKWMEYRGLPADRPPLPHARLWTILAALTATAAALYHLQTHPYRRAPHRLKPPMELKDPAGYFWIEENRFTRNLLGLPSRPISLAVVARENPCPRFQQGGWKDLPKVDLKIPPIFWHAREPICRLSLKTPRGTMLLDLWATRLRSRGRPVYLGAADAVTGRRWRLLPEYLPAIAPARDLAAKALKRLYPHAALSVLKVGTPRIRKHATGQPYLDDAKVVWVETEITREDKR